MPDRFTFTIAARDGRARTGTIAMQRGEIRTPAFMPVGTAATVKAMKPADVRASGADPASLRYESVPVPRPEPGEVLVQVRATAITAGELTWPETWPVIPCHDLSGVVVGAGPGRSGWQDGDEVFGLIAFARPGAAAEYTTVSAADLAAKPAAIGHVAAAAIPLGGLTAWKALHTHAHLRPGGQHCDDDLAGRGRFSGRARGPAAPCSQCVDRSPYDVEPGYPVAGLQKIGCHRRPHIAEPDKADIRHRSSCPAGTLSQTAVRDHRAARSGRRRCCP